MLLVRTGIRPSPIDALGVFAEEDINRGALVWRFDSRFDLRFSQEMIQTFPLLMQEYLRSYAFLSTASNLYVLSADHDRFMNHSSIHDNIDVQIMVGEEEVVAIAKRDIRSGEELLVNYRTFDENDRLGKDPYLDT